MTPEDLDQIRAILRDAGACRTPAPPAPWVPWARALASGLGILAALWLGAAYLFVTDSEAAAIHQKIVGDTDEQIDKLLEAVRLGAAVNGVQDTRLDAHEKRLDARRPR